MGDCQLLGGSLLPVGRAQWLMFCSGVLSLFFLFFFPGQVVDWLAVGGVGVSAVVQLCCVTQCQWLAMWWLVVFGSGWFQQLGWFYLFIFFL
jgi:hypothetical protein